jgi:putative transposase
MMDALQALPPTVPVSRGCMSLGVSRATLYRRTSPPRPPKPRLSPATRALSPTERDDLVSVMHAPEFTDQPPREIYATLLSMGIYLASIRTMYRVLKALGEANERRRGHERASHTVPQLEAFAPHQVWTWDITKVAGLTPGVWYFVHVIIDHYSRHIVGWM